MAIPNKKSLITLVVIILIILVIDVIGGFFVVSKVIIPMVYKSDEFAEGDESSAEKSKVDKTIRPAGVKKPLDSINLNPAQSNGEIFACDIVLEAADEETATEITNRDFEIMDKLSTYLSFKTVDELNDPNNWGTFKKDMFVIVNDILAPGEILELYVPSKIIQFQ